MLQLLISLIAGFAAGLATRLFWEKAIKRKLLRMENDMLKNHSRILALQQKISLLEVGKNKPAKQ